MPRTADHDQRRGAIARAFQHLLAVEGPAHTSFVRVAAEAGVSVGLIQHYFSSKEELLRFAYEDCMAEIGARIEGRIREGEAAEEPIAEMMLTAICELLPLDENRRLEHRVTQHLLAQSFTDPYLTAVARRAESGLRARIVTAVDNGKLCGEVRDDVDTGTASSMLLAASHGVVDAVALQGPDSAPISARQVLRPIIGLVFTGRCHHFDADSRSLT